MIQLSFQTGPRRAWGCLAAALALTAARAGAQCVVPPSSNEAKLLAFFEAPVAFSPPAAPEVLPPWAVRVEAEVVPIPSPSASITRTGYCFLGKSEHPRITPVFGRPRVTVGLPAGLVVEASYVPPVTVHDAQPDLASFALSEVRALTGRAGRSQLTLMVRAHGTVGRVRGPITCPATSLQTTNSNDPCFGTTPSRDTFHPYMFGGEGALGLTSPSGRWSVYAGGGVSWLRPRFTVGFTDGTGYTDNTRVQVNLTRGSVFGGVTARLVRAFALSVQVYSVPADVTTWRFGAGYRIR
ncbi:MAG: hypothetical protein IRY91_04070 [Gemmatimonadaceae bacterium]|nr:hypothetical protein [Gemmatimonadaceae bacterium]